VSKETKFDILADLQTELSGQFLQDDFEVQGRTFTMRLLNEEENAWTYSGLLAGGDSTISLAMSARIANLAIGIRSINDATIGEMFESKFNDLPESEQRELAANKPIHFAYAGLFLRWLAVQPPEFITELVDKWQELESRKKDAMGEIKNSSGESSDSEEKKS